MRNLFALFALLAADTVVRAAEFPAPYNSEKDTQSSAMSPTDAAKGFSVPPGFKVSVFAAEPEVQNPIAMSWDPRGRLWIAENYTYAERPTKFDMGLYDRVVMFEDTDHDGRADQRTVFTDRVQMLTGLEVGHGGVWLMCPPQVLFIADRDGDDKPDGEPEVVLDGFTLSPENYHNFANGLRFGPDGWLYGRCGASCPGEVGVPGTDDKHRWPVRGGIWRYHPTRKTFETICHGTTNPWGMDWNERGELFFVNTVNGHLWHSIPGAHFDRPHTQDPNPRCYAQMQMHADHWHWDTGEKWSDSRGATGEHGRLGGGHAHSGTSIYLGQNWPREYFGKLLTLNLHGRRVNVESLQRAGSGYVGKHDPDMLQAADPWFRGIELGYGPDGGVYILDWSDTGECHEQTGVHRTSGRIFKVTYGQPVRPKVRDLGKLDSETLVSLAVGDRGAEWFVRQVRLVLAERAAQGERIQRKLPGVFYTSPEAALDDLRKLWAAYSIGEIDHPRLVSLLRNPDESIRTWAIRLLSDDWPIDSILGPMPDVATKVDPALLDKFAGMAASDGSGLVRLALASTIQRLPVELRTKLAAPLVARSEDANDQNLPLLVWYGLIPVADANPDSLVTLVEKSQWPLIRRFVARRLAEEIDERPAPVDALVQLAVQKDFSEAAVCDVVAGMVEGLAGRRKARPPEKWSSLAERVAGMQQQKAAEQVRELSVVFGDGRALGELIALAQDKDAELVLRRAALETLIEQRPPELRKICEKLLGERFINSTAIKGLAAFDDPALGKKLAQNYKNFYKTERAVLVETLVSRPVFAAALLDEVAAGKIPATEISAFQARQIRSFHDGKLDHRLRELWGELRDSPEDKRQAQAELKSRLTKNTISHADLGAGRAVFNKVCASCHRLYGQGGQIGPDLTGAGRHNIDYLLENILDPSAVVTAGFRMSVAVLSDGRVINGIVVEQTPKTVTIQTAKERMTLDRGDIEQMEPSPLSLMPDGLLQPLKPEEVRDLFGYLMHPVQVALPPEAQEAQAAAGR